MSEYDSRHLAKRRTTIKPMSNFRAPSGLPDEVGVSQENSTLVESIARRTNLAVDGEREGAEAPTVTPPTQQPALFTEAGSAAVASLLHLLKLMGSELVLLHGGDIVRFEQAVRTKAADFTSPTPNQQARDIGLAAARQLIEQVLIQIRAQAELRKSLAAGCSDTRPGGGSSSFPETSRLLN